MDTESEKLHQQRRKTWQTRLWRWTWITVVILVKITFRVTVGIIWITAALIGIFLNALGAAYSPKHYRQLKKSQGDHRWG